MSQYANIGSCPRISPDFPVDRLQQALGRDVGTISTDRRVVVVGGLGDLALGKKLRY